MLLLDGSSSFDPEGGSLTASWLLQNKVDHGTSVQVPVSDDFTEPVTLTVQDSAGGEQSSVDLVQIYNLPPEVTINRQAQQLATFTDPGVLDTHTAMINWGDGSPQESEVISENGGNGIVYGSHLHHASVFSQVRLRAGFLILPKGWWEKRKWKPRHHPHN